MNPVLLKPQSETGSQVVVQGRVHATARAREYQAMKPGLMPYVLDSFARMQAEADIVLVEGAGSASEVNLRAGDIANMGFARAAGTPVVVVGDIDRGGVIASLIGTHAVLDPADAAMVHGFIVNRMRGDLSLFDAGMALIAARTGWAPLGLVPHFPGAALLPAEDAADLGAAPGRSGATLRVAVPVLPRISNFDDLDPLLAEPGVQVLMVQPGQPLPVCDLVLLPGSKATIADLDAFRAAGWDGDLVAHRRRGGRVLGVCGGYQMLGTRIEDPDGVEGPAGAVPGLGLLDVATVLTREKRLSEAAGTACAAEACHSAVTRCTSGARTARRRPPRCCDTRTDAPTGRAARTAWCRAPTSTACSRTTRSANAWLRRLGAFPCGALLRRRRWRRRWTPWPLTWKRTWTWTGCSASHADGGPQQQHGAGLQGAGGPIQGQGAAEVSRVWPPSRPSPIQASATRTVP